MHLKQDTLYHTNPNVRFLGGYENCPLLLLKRPLEKAIKQVWNKETGTSLQIPTHTVPGLFFRVSSVAIAGWLQHGAKRISAPGQKSRGHAQPCLQIAEFGVAQHLQDTATEYEDVLN